MGLGATEKLLFSDLFRVQVVETSLQNKSKTAYDRCSSFDTHKVGNLVGLGLSSIAEGRRVQWYASPFRTLQSYKNIRILCLEEIWGEKWIFNNRRGPFQSKSCVFVLCGDWNQTSIFIPGKRSSPAMEIIHEQKGIITMDKLADSNMKHLRNWRDPINSILLALALET